MNDQMLFLGLPFNTWTIVGGLYILASFLPVIIALIMNHKGEKKPNE